MQLRFKHIFFLCFAIVAIALTACEKEITVDMPEPDPKIVVEGFIFQGEGAYVVLSRNAAYFAPIDSISIINSFIVDAIVTVTDGVNTDTLTFQETSKTGYGFAYMKTSPTVKGQPGKTYTLTVRTNGETVTAQTSIVPPIPIDSLNWKLETDSDTFGFVWTYFTDPGIDQRGYAIFSRRISQIPKHNQKRFRRNMYILNDIFWSQQIKFGVGKGDNFGHEPSDDEPFEDDRDGWRLGDTVKIRLCTIDLPTYNFLNSLEVGIDNAESPFGSPINVVSNINGGLGCFSGYGVTEVQVVCQ